MNDRIAITYSILGNQAKEIAEAIRVEQSIEFPFDLASERIQHEVVGQIESISAPINNRTQVVISYDQRVVGAELPQLLNVLWGNVSLIPGVRITDLVIPDSLLNTFKGPRFGIAGLRTFFNAPDRPLITTALKPMGSSVSELAQMATTLASAGFDIIKDDHSLANQPWARWRERVEAVAIAVREANAKSGHKTLYAPSLNLPADQIFNAAQEAKSLGAGALLLLPGISGFDAMRAIAHDDSIGLPIQSHPSMLGSMLTSGEQGVAHPIVLGTLMRIAGADISIFPNFSGRFSFTKQECLSITDAAQSQLGNLKSMWVAPAGGMSLDRIPQMREIYGSALALLIGGALSRGSLAENAKAMVEMVGINKKNW